MPTARFKALSGRHRAPTASTPTAAPHTALRRPSPRARRLPSARLAAPARSPTASLHVPPPRQPPSRPPLSEPRRPSPSPVARHRSRRAAVSTLVSHRPAISRTPVLSRRRLARRRAAACTRAHAVRRALAREPRALRRPRPRPSGRGPCARVAAGRARAVCVGHAHCASRLSVNSAQCTRLILLISDYSILYKFKNLCRIHLNSENYETNFVGKV
jgi:hypothetical protein